MAPNTILLPHPCNEIDDHFLEEVEYHKGQYRRFPQQSQESQDPDDVEVEVVSIREGNGQWFFWDEEGTRHLHERTCKYHRAVLPFFSGVADIWQG